MNASKTKLFFTHYTLMFIKLIISMICWAATPQ